MVDQGKAFALQMLSTWSIFAKNHMKSADMKTKDVPFTEFDLPQEVLKGIATAGFSHCTRVQAMALPITLKGGDVAAQAQTGTNGWLPPVALTTGGAAVSCGFTFRREGSTESARITGAALA